jgi:hypothetical protein
MEKAKLGKSDDVFAGAAAAAAPDFSLFNPLDFYWVGNERSLLDIGYAHQQPTLHDPDAAFLLAEQTLVAPPPVPLEADGLTSMLHSNGLPAAAESWINMAPTGRTLLADSQGNGINHVSWDQKLLVPHQLSSPDA